MDEHFLKHATREQLSAWAEISNKAQAMERLHRDPPIYQPIRNCCGIVLSVSFQCEQPVYHTMGLYGIKGRTDSFKAIIDAQKQSGRGGWHKWYGELAKHMPYGMGTFYGEIE